MNCLLIIDTGIWFTFYDPQNICVEMNSWLWYFVLLQYKSLCLHNLIKNSYGAKMQSILQYIHICFPYFPIKWSGWDYKIAQLTFIIFSWRISYKIDKLIEIIFSELLCCWLWSNNWRFLHKTMCDWWFASQAGYFGLSWSRGIQCDAWTVHEKWRRFFVGVFSNWSFGLWWNFQVSSTDFKGQRSGNYLIFYIYCIKLNINTYIFIERMSFLCWWLATNLIWKHNELWVFEWLNILQNVSMSHTFNRKCFILISFVLASKII